MRADDTEISKMIDHLVNPPQGGNYLPLPLSAFPDEYPFPWYRIYDYDYFWLKFYASQRNYFAIAKKPIYMNLELLVNAFNTNAINLEHAEIYDLQNDKMSLDQLEELLTLHN